MMLSKASEVNVIDLVKAAGTSVLPLSILELRSKEVVASSRDGCTVSRGVWNGGAEDARVLKLEQ